MTLSSISRKHGFSTVGRVSLEKIGKFRNITEFEEFLKNESSIFYLLRFDSQTS